MEKFADDSFKFDEKGRKFLKWVEITVGKGTLLVTSNFSFSHRVSKRLVLQTHKNQGLFGKELTLSQTSLGFYLSTVQVF